jgi:hypothetical protein
MSLSIDPETRKCNPTDNPIYFCLALVVNEKSLLSNDEIVKCVFYVLNVIVIPIGD